MSRAPSVRIVRSQSSTVIRSQAAARRARAGSSSGTRRHISSICAARAPSSTRWVERDPGQVAAVALEVAAPGDQLVAGAVLRERRDAELVGEARDPVLGRPDPLAAEIEDVVADPARQRAAADPIAGLDHDHVGPGGAELARRAQARQPGADHDHVVHPRHVRHDAGDPTTRRATPTARGMLAR